MMQILASLLVLISITQSFSITEHDLGTQSYDQSVAACEAVGQTLASKDEVLDYLGGALGDDVWTPVYVSAGSFNDWLQIGGGTWPYGVLHTEIENGLKPSWGTEATTEYVFKKKFYCSNTIRPAITDPRECLTTQTNMVAWYNSDSIDILNNKWTDKIGGHDGVIVDATGIAVFDGADDQNELYLNGQTIVSGTSATRIDFGNTPFMVPDHTVFNLCKYRDNAAKRGRILDAKLFNGLYGFWWGKSGMAHETGWITQDTQSEFGDNWVLSSQRLDLYRGNGIVLSLPGKIGSALASNLDINNGQAIPDEESDWACGEIIVVNEKLSDNEIQCVEDYFSCKYDLGLTAHCGTETLLASENVCFNAKKKLYDYTFNPPANGIISGIKLVHTSGDVRCSQLDTLGTAFGCGNGWGAPNGALLVEMIEEIPGEKKTYYPATGTDGFNLRAGLQCTNGGGCSIGHYDLAGYTGEATEIQFNNPTYEVTKNQEFSIQYGEGCCEESTADNKGESCAKVYFIYDETYLGCPNKPDSFDWDSLTADGTNIPELYTAEDDIFSIPDGTLSLNVKIELEYEGAATGDTGDGPFGVTYVLDFEDFNAYKDHIYEPGTCQNREGNDFYAGTNLRPFNEWWGYSDDPNLPGQIGSQKTMAYPPQTNTFWTQTMSSNDDCGIIVYEGTFTWNDLVACAKTPGGKSYVETKDGPGDITLSGVLFVNVVSPYAKAPKDASEGDGFYRVYQLLSKAFEIKISKSVYVLGAAGVNVLTMSVIAVYKENAEEEPQNDFRLVVLTESQNYLQLSAASTGYLFNPATGATIEQGDFTWPTGSEQGGDCLNNKAYICSQLWVIKADQVDCKTKGIDFSGKYTLNFDTSCRDGPHKTYCAGDIATGGNNKGWLAEHESIEDGVSLEAKLTWKDEICDPKIFNIQFEATMGFYTDSNYNKDINGIPDGEGQHLFKVGEDNIYVEIDTDFASGNTNVFDTKLINVWICTFAPGYAVDYNFDAALHTGGCWDANRDGCENVDQSTCDAEEFENPYFYHIYQGQAQPTPISLEDFNEINTDSESKLLRFYFTLPHRIARDTLYVQAQVEVTLQSGGTPRRALLLLYANKEANKMDHFIKGAGLTHDNNNHPNNNPQPPQYPQEPINYPQPQPQLPLPNTNPFIINLSSPWVIGIGSLLVVILTFNIIFMCYMNCNKQQRARVSFDSRRRNGYSSVKNIDSDVVNDSEVNAINVVSDQSN